MNDSSGHNGGDSMLFLLLWSHTQDFNPSSSDLSNVLSWVCCMGSLVSFGKGYSTFTGVVISVATLNINIGYIVSDIRLCE